MKFKIDFVTNSSCASFVISKNYLNPMQLQTLRHIEQFAEMYCPEEMEHYEGQRFTGWTITETDDEMKGYTSMDNFDMLKLLIEIGIREDKIEYEGCY